MKVAVTATGGSLASQVDPRFGRALWFVILEVARDEGDVPSRVPGVLVETVDNGAGQAAAQGAGIQAAERLHRAGVSAVITGHCGPKAFQSLSMAGIEVYVDAEGTVSDAVTRFRAGGLKPLQAADVGGHWA
jgi:predicted Fe-Mo cluster-binding NifX family protein